MSQHRYIPHTPDDVAAMLDEIGRETADELAHLPVRDWNYSWQQAYDYWLVDEYQDVNDLQDMLFKIISNNEKSCGNGLIKSVVDL